MIIDMYMNVLGVEQLIQNNMNIKKHNRRIRNIKRRNIKKLKKIGVLI